MGGAPMVNWKYIGSWATDIALWAAAGGAFTLLMS
jgi:hypothetical protein